MAWETRSQKTPPVTWDAHESEFRIRLGNIDARWKPPITYVIRIREVGTEEWSVGFEMPLTGCTFVDLKPGIEYEVKLTAKNEAGEGEPTFRKVRTLGAVQF